MAVMLPTSLPATETSLGSLERSRSSFPIYELLYITMISGFL